MTTTSPSTADTTSTLPMLDPRAWHIGRSAEVHAAEVLGGVGTALCGRPVRSGRQQPVAAAAAFRPGWCARCLYLARHSITSGAARRSDLDEREPPASGRSAA